MLSWKSWSLAAATMALALQSPASAAVTYAFIGSDFVDDLSFTYTTDAPVDQPLGVNVPCTNHSGAATCALIFLPDGFPTFHFGNLTVTRTNNVAYDLIAVTVSNFSFLLDLPPGQLGRNGNVTDPFNGQTAISGLSEAVPEPAAWALMMMGLGLAGAALRHRRRSAPAGAVA